MADTPATPPPASPGLQQDYKDLMMMVHHMPVGVVQADRDGLIHLMNPKATQLLAPLGFNDGDLNLFAIVDKASPDLRMLVNVFSGQQGIICENFRVELPSLLRGTAGTEVLGLTVTLLQNVTHGLLVVITDETHVERLRRMKANLRDAG